MLTARSPLLLPKSSSEATSRSFGFVPKEKKTAPAMGAATVLGTSRPHESSKSLPVLEEAERGLLCSILF